MNTIDNLNKTSLTIIITASYIRSHPSIRIIKKTIESIEKIHANGCKIIIAHDYSNERRYNEYLANLKEYIKKYHFDNISLVMNETHGHLVGSLRNALRYVTTKWLLIVQHDFPFIQEFYIDKVIDDMELNEKLKHVKFSYRKITNPPLPPFSSRKWDFKNNLYGKQVYGRNHTYTRTPAWADWNHLCRTKYYTDVVLKKCHDGVPMEHTLNPLCTKDTHEFYGTYFFGGLGQGPFIFHLNGRRALKSPGLNKIYVSIKMIERSIRHLVLYKKYKNKE